MLRCDVQVGLKEGPQASSEESTGGTTDSCFTCKPVSEQMKPTFQSFVRADIELRHSKRVLHVPTIMPSQTS